MRSPALVCPFYSPVILFVLEKVDKCGLDGYNFWDDPFLLSCFEVSKWAKKCRLNIHEPRAQIKSHLVCLTHQGTTVDYQEGHFLRLVIP